MTPARLLQVLRSRWPLALAVIACALLGTAAVSLLLPAQYKATASLLVDMRSPDPLAGSVLGSMLSSGYMATQIDVVQSERVLRRAIASLGLEHDAAMLERWHDDTGGQGDFPAWLAERLQRKLEVRPTRESGVMSVAFTGSDASQAAATTNAIIDAYIETTLELRVQPARRYSDFFDERARQLRTALEQAQARLSAYQQANGIVADDERLDIETLRLNELSSRLVALQAASADSGTRAQAAQAGAERTSSVFASPSVAGLNAELMRQQVRLAELQERLADNHPQIVDTQKATGALREQIAVEMQRVARGLDTEQRIDREREAQLRTMVAEQRAKVLRLKGQRDEAAVLRRDVENARIAYDTVQQRAGQAGLESHATQTNVALLRRATAPAAPSAPKLGANLAVALVLGCLLALAAVLLRELQDRRMRTVDDVVDGLRQPLLVVLPSAQTWLSADQGPVWPTWRMLRSLPAPPQRRAPLAQGR